MNSVIRFSHSMFNVSRSIFNIYIHRCLLVLALASAIWVSTTPSANAVIDPNQNSMSELWEEFYNSTGLIPTTGFDPQDDADGDGQSNVKEYPSGPNPVSGANFFNAEITHIPAVYVTPLEEGGAPEGGHA